MRAIHFHRLIRVLDREEPELCLEGDADGFGDALPLRNGFPQGGEGMPEGIDDGVGRVDKRAVKIKAYSF